MPGGTNDWFVFAKDVGLPWAALLGIGYALLRFAWWAEPLLRMVIVAHSEFVNVMSKELPEHGKRLDRQSDVVDDTFQLANETREVVKDTADKVEDIHEEMVQKVASRRAARQASLDEENRNDGTATVKQITEPDTHRES